MSTDINMQKRIFALKNEIESLREEKKVYVKALPKLQEALKKLGKSEDNLEIASRNLKKYYSSKSKDITKKRKQILELEEIEKKLNHDVGYTIITVKDTIVHIEDAIKKKNKSLNKLQKSNEK